MRVPVNTFAAALVALLGSAFAASADTWTGLYGGLSIGRAWSDFSVLDGPGTPHCWWCVNNYGGKADDFSAGGQLGYNYELNNLVLGIEGEIAGGTLSGTVFDPTHVGPSGSVDGNLYGAVTGRLGYSFGPVLVYGKAGWGWLDADIEWSDPVYSASAKQDKTLSGAVFGGGIEYAISPAMSVKAEYMRLDFADTTVLDVKGYCCGFQQPIEVGPIDTFRVGLNIHLNGTSY
jgi:outer membrane immunogenic protein